MKKGQWSLAAVAVVAALASSSVMAGTASHASAGPNPQVAAAITKVFDGTGHGTPDATFVSGEDFVPGDNTPDDGVVSSHDTVGYEVVLGFQAGLARTVALEFDSTEYLEWTPEAKGELCRPVGTIAARLSAAGDRCLFTIRQGATGTVARTVSLLARDSGGRAIFDEYPSVHLSVEGARRHSTAQASEPVTVVSAPRADLVIWPGPDQFPSRPGTLNYYEDKEGSFDLIPRGLSELGFSAFKGVSTAGTWSADIDVSAFPPSAIWFWEGRQVSPQQGLIRVGQHQGPGRLSFRVSEWNEQEPGSTVWYDVGVAVATSSFSSPDYQNNGTGNQPGDGQPATWSTQDPITGAIAGHPHANNDWSAARVFRPVDEGSPQPFAKSLSVPRDRSQTIHEPGNMFWESSVATEASIRTRPTQVVRGTQLLGELSVDTRQLDAEDPSPIILADTWDPSQTEIDEGYPIVLIGPDGSEVEPQNYRLQWSNSVEGAASTDLAGEGWYDGAPEVGARAVRVIIFPGSLPLGEEEGAGLFTLPVYTRISADFDNVGEPFAADTLFASFGQQSIRSEQRVEVIDSPTAQSSVEYSLVSTAGEVTPGDRVDLTVVPTIITPLALSQGFSPQVRVFLDRCMLSPVNTSTSWKMEVLEGQPENGRICGNDDASPVSLIFTPASSPMQVAQWNHSEQEGTFPPITFAVQAARSASNDLRSNAELTFAANEADGTSATGDVTIPLNVPTERTMAQLQAEESTVEVGGAMRWEVLLDAYFESEGATNTTIIALPHLGDADSYWDLVSNPEDYEGSRRSDFSGTYSVTSLRFDPDNTSPTATLWFTTDEAPSLDPAADTSWYLGAEAGKNGTPPLALATAAKVVAKSPSAQGGASTATVQIEIQPSGAEDGDVYVLWAGQSLREGSDVQPTPMPWPADITQVSATLGGAVWWDANRDAVFDSDEAGIEGVTIGLFGVDDSGQIDEAAPLQQTTTKEDGTYSFSGLQQGSYVAKVMERGPNLPEEAETYYGRAETEQTYSYFNRTFLHSSLRSNAVQLGRGSDYQVVDFGFFEPQPKMDVDKSPGVIGPCSNGVCPIAWEVTLKNLGNAPITAGTLTDVMSDSVYDVQMGGGIFEAPVRSVVDRGGQGAYALTADGKVYSWGVGANGANGNGSDRDNLRPELVRGLEDVRVTDVVARGEFGGYALTANGLVYSWGRGASGANGDDSNQDNLEAKLVQGLDDVHVTDVIARRGGRGAYVRTLDGKIYAWGQGNAGANGSGSLADNLQAQPVRGLEGIRVSSVVDRAGQGGYAVCADGDVYSWGSNGDLQNQHVTSATRVSGIDVVDVTEVISLGAGGAYAITSNGQVYTWGAHLWGASGIGMPIGTAENVTSATRVLGMEGKSVKQVVARGDQEGAYALTTDGLVYSWGWGSFGGNGNGSTNNNRTAQLVQGFEQADPVTKVVARESMGGFALTRAGHVYSWGLGRFGGNGNGSEEQNSTAMPVQGLEDVRVVDVASRQMQGGLVLSDQGELYSWGTGANGSNGNGQPDANNLQAKPVLAQVDTLDSTAPLSGVAQLTERRTIGGYALTNSGQVLAWGGGARGANGQGTAANNPVAEDVAGLPRGITIDTVQLPIATVNKEGMNERQYRINLLPVGEKLTFNLTGKVNQRALSHNVLNQVWFTAPLTPITGVLPDGLTAPARPADPGLPTEPGNSFNVRGIPNNPTCDTDVENDDGSKQNTDKPDSCDQIPVNVLAAENPSQLGSLSGAVWVDQEREGTRPPNAPTLQGIEVTLLRGPDLIPHASTTTDEAGTYRFTDLTPGDYSVKFAVLGVAPAAELVEILGLPEGIYSFAFSQASEPCGAGVSCAQPDTATTPPINLAAQQDLAGIDAGVFITSTSITVIKGDEKGEVNQDGNIEVKPVSLESGEDGKSAAREVPITIANNGTDTLERIEWEDQTQVGPELGNLTCLQGSEPLTDLEELVLPVGEKIECTATLPAMKVADTHRDLLTVEAWGVDSGVHVSDQDAWEAHVEGNPAGTLHKSANPAPESRVGVGETITYTLTATNTGNMPLVGSYAVDDLSNVLDNAALVEPLADSLILDSEKKTLTWSIPEIQPGDSTQTSFTVRVHSNAWGQTITNSVSGILDDTGTLEPSCAQESPCTVNHEVAPWPAALPLPFLGGRSALPFSVAGGVLVLIAATYALLRKRSVSR